MFLYKSWSQSYFHWKRCTDAQENEPPEAGAGVAILLSLEAVHRSVTFAFICYFFGKSQSYFHWKRCTDKTACAVGMWKCESQSYFHWKRCTDQRRHAWLHSRHEVAILLSLEAVHRFFYLNPFNQIYFSRNPTFTGSGAPINYGFMR